METTEIPETGRSKKKIIGTVVSVAIFVFFVLLMIGMNIPREAVDIECVSEDAEFVGEDRLRINVELKNTGGRDVTVEVEFKTKWSGGSDSKTKEVLIPAGESRTLSETLDCNPRYGSETQYEVEWKWEKY